ncbi:hypothetical protein BC830DRAFT_1097511 [Chytriomyces sp. MP71]|nr:hypothetical protein BC830DRAFT_1097511 [Chytriomyces sp. MP71]
MDASMQDLQKNIFQQTVEKDKLSYEIEHLQAELQSQKTREGNQAQLQTFKLQQKIETLQAELEQSQLEVENRNEQLTQFKASLSKQHLVSSQAELKVSEQNHEIQLLQFQVAHLKQSIETTWKPQYAELQQRAKELAAELHSAQKSASQFQHEHLDETDKNHVYSSSTGQKVHSDQLVVQISSLKNELEQMTLHLQQKLSSEANAAKVVVDALQLALAPMHRTLEKFAASSNLAHQVSPHQHNSQLDIEAENLQLKASKKKLLEEIDSLDNTLKDCKRELSIAQSKVLYMEDVMKKSSSLPEAQKTEVLRLQQAIDELKNELAIHTSQASKQIEKTRSLERENEELRSSYSNLRVQASALASELSATTDHLAQMRSQVVQYANQALQYEMETKTQSQVCEEARSKLQQEEQTVRGLRNELSALQHAHNTHFASLSKASNLNAFSSAERNSLIHQIKSLKKKLEKANKEVSDIQSSHDSKLQQIFNKLEQSKVVHQLYLQSVSVPSGGDLTDNTLLRGHRIKSLAADLKGILKSI